MTLEQMQAQRTQLLDQIHAKGGIAKAPNLAARLTALESDIRAARKQASVSTPTTGGQTSAGGQQTDPGGVPTGQTSQGSETTQQEDTGAGASTDTTRIQTRIDYLKRVRPGDPEIKQLQAKLAKAQPGAGNGGGGSGNGADSGANIPGSESVDDFINRIMDGYTGVDLGKAPKLMTDEDFQSERKSLEDSIYGQNTQYNDRNRARDLEETRQQLAERGIPFDPAAVYDPNTKNLYGKTLGTLNEKYEGLDRTARDNARTTASSLAAQEQQVNTNSYNAWVDSASQAAKSQIDALNAGSGLVQTLVTKYGMSLADAQALADRKSREKIAKLGLSKIGGGGNNSGSGSSGAGFEIS